MEAESPQNPEIKEGFGLLGEVHYEDLGNGRLKCLETGHELLLKDVDSYGNSKKCRLALIDRALQNKRAPLNSFEQSPLDRCKLICKLTGDTINKTEEHIWKHISGRKFQNKLGFYGSKSLEYGSVKLTLIRCSPSIYSWKRKAKFYGFVSCKEQVFARAEYKLGHMKDALEELDVSEVFMATLCDYYNLSTELIPYKDALSWQKRLVEAKQALLEEDGDVCGSLVVLQHPPVYTLGTRSSEKYLHFDLQHSPIDIFRTDRGGEVTYHGPGQLVMYPIMNLRHYKMDLHWYLRALEEVIIRALWSGFSVKGSRIDGLTGVWVGNQKVAAIGIHVSRWITYHGLAINVTTDLKPFSKIVPCGISDRAVGSLFEILNSTSCQDDSIPRLKGSSQTLDASTLLDLTLKSLLKEFSEVFQVDLIEKITLDVRSISEFANS